MEDIKNINDSFNEVKIHKPKAVRLCPSSKKSTKCSLSSSTSTANSEISINQFNAEETKIDLENISIEEINTDFFICSQALEEEQCHEELYDIMNNSMERENKKENLEMMSNSYFDELIDDLNDLCCKENEEGEE